MIRRLFPIKKIYHRNLMRDDGLTELLCDQSPKRFVDDQMERGIDKQSVS